MPLDAWRVHVCGHWWWLMGGDVARWAERPLATATHVQPCTVIYPMLGQSGRWQDDTRTGLWFSWSVGWRGWRLCVGSDYVTVRPPAEQPSWDWLRLWNKTMLFICHRRRRKWAKMCSDGPRRASSRRVPLATGNCAAAAVSFIDFWRPGRYWRDWETGTRRLRYAALQMLDDFAGKLNWWHVFRRKTPVIAVSYCPCPCYSVLVSPHLCD